MKIETKNSNQSSSEQEPLQILEGTINNIVGRWWEGLPPGVTREMVMLFLAADGWRWHLGPQYIRDCDEREKWLQEMHDYCFD